MKKTALLSGTILIAFLFTSYGLHAQRYLGYCPAMEELYYDLNLTEKQLEEIEKLEIALGKELSPIISRLRTQYAVLDDLEIQRNPDPSKIDAAWDAIFEIEADIREKEILHENKIKDLLTEEQRVLFDAYLPYGMIPYGRGGFGRGYFGRGFRGYRGGQRNMGRGYDRTLGLFGRGAGQLGPGRYFRPMRYGRGPCGAGFGWWYRWNSYRNGWKR